VFVTFERLRSRGKDRLHPSAGEPIMHKYEPRVTAHAASSSEAL